VFDKDNMLETFFQLSLLLSIKIFRDDILSLVISVATGIGRDWRKPKI